MIEIFTDGSSTSNRNGYGAIILRDGVNVAELAGTCSIGTNQSMELKAALIGCEYAEQKYIVKDAFPQEHIVVYSDSAYLINCVNAKWYVNWFYNGWINSANKPVANKELWEKLIIYFENPNFEFKKVAGHSGHIYNDRADSLATGKSKPENSENLTTYKKYDNINI